jgi:hypothetical protein
VDSIKVEYISSRFCYKYQRTFDTSMTKVTRKEFKDKDKTVENISR